MTTPEPPDDVPADVPADDAAPPRPSLHDRLAEFESGDDDLFDDLYDEEPAVDAAAGDVTSYDDSAFAAVGEPSDDAEDVPPLESAPTVVLDKPVHETAVLDPFAAAPVPLAAVAADPQTEPLDVAPVEPPVEPPDGPPDEPPDEPLPAEPVDGPAGVSGAAPAAGAAAVAADKPSRKRRTGRRLTLPVVALLVMTALMAAATTYLWLQVREHDRTETARRSGLEASRDAARLLFSYDYRTLDKDFATGRALTTGEFRSQYDKTTTKVVADVAKQYKAVVKANVVGAGVVRATPDTVVTVVYVNQVTTSTRVTGEKVDLSRVRMTLHRSGGKWLVTSVNAL